MKEMDRVLAEFDKSSGVVTDTRKITQNCLFFCLKGTNFNGNLFAQEAMEKGARAVVIDDPNQAINDKTILVTNVLKTLQKLATLHRKRFTIPIIGITGSNGKTTSKELISAVLATQKKVHFTSGNLNNHIGVPLTLLALKSHHEIAVIEMGANKPGDIKELVEIAEPTHGIITNVGRAHLEGFGSLEGVIQTKTEMYQYLEKNKGTIFVNQEDNQLTTYLVNTMNVIPYNSIDFSGELKRLNPFVEMTWTENGIQSHTLKTNLIGEYNYFNFLAAICIGRFFDITAENCNVAIENYIPSNNRSQVSVTDKNTLIVDCYNANPSSMQSALRSFAQIETAQKIVILGDMLEMGADSEMVHREIVDLCIELRLSGFFVGEEFLKLKGSHPQAIFLKSTSPLIEHFIQVPPADLTILLKGSRGLALENLISFL